ncbi:MAG: hypothetical protein LQ342_000539 [Letrouitia transgressa]|nr:MAG: hypothetical protein LQ342_000539 [Letrouitia transgressa]
MAHSYKSLKEDFVSNLSGGSIQEINYVTAVAPAALMLWSALQSRQRFFLSHSPKAYLTDFLLNVCAILFATTIYSSAPILLNLLLLFPAACLFVFPPARSRQKPALKGSYVNGVALGVKENQSLDPLPERPFITAYRGGMIVVTCIAILAVDFRIFPRRFAKVETWGTSLMDMGVGSFVFSAGVVSARPILKARLAGRPIGLSLSLQAAAKHSLPLFILGLVRLYSVKGLDYAEHVTEYGVHWNFFFTLALIPPLTALFQPLSRLLPTVAVFSLLISFTYQAVLESTKIQAYILTAPRTDLISQNREGLFSICGYLPIFLAGQAVGFDILRRNMSENSNTVSGTQQRQQVLIRLVSWSAGWILLFFLSSSYRFGIGIQVSRRLANAPYIFWVAAFNSTQITMFCLVETIFFPGVYKATEKGIEAQECKKATSRILAAFNNNGLALFLLANLLTGCINMSVDTLKMPRERALGILLGYAALLTTVALVLHEKKFSLKI